jgi:hypothetical protein
MCKGLLILLQLLRGVLLLYHRYWGMDLRLLSGTAIIVIMQLSEPLIKKKKWQGEFHNCHEVQQCLMEKLRTRVGNKISHHSMNAN